MDNMSGRIGLSGKPSMALRHRTVRKKPAVKKHDSKEKPAKVAKQQDGKSKQPSTEKGDAVGSEPEVNNIQASGSKPKAGKNLAGDGNMSEKTASGRKRKVLLKSKAGGCTPANENNKATGIKSSVATNEPGGIKPSSEENKASGSRPKATTNEPCGSKPKVAIKPGNGSTPKVGKTQGGGTQPQPKAPKKQPGKGKAATSRAVGSWRDRPPRKGTDYDTSSSDEEYHCSSSEVEIPSGGEDEPLFQDALKKMSKSRLRQLIITMDGVDRLKEDGKDLKDVLKLLHSAVLDVESEIGVASRMVQLAARCVDFQHGVGPDYEEEADVEPTASGSEKKE